MDGSKYVKPVVTGNSIAPRKPGTVIVSGNFSKDLPLGTAAEILCQSGLKGRPR